MSLIEKAMQGALGRPAAGAEPGDAAPAGPARAAGGVAPLTSLLVLGAGGTLGSALLAEVLVAGRFERVYALVRQPLASALRGFVPLPAALLREARLPPLAAAVIVFERSRHSNGRDEAFVEPRPDELPKLARRLHAAGVRRLVVVVPHAPALLPRALAAGYASLDEAAVGALGFEQLVFVRAAQEAAGSRERGLVPRMVRWWFSQLRWMVPQQEQPVRAATLARWVAAVLRALPTASAGTRVLAPDRLWQLAQAGAAGRGARPAGAVAGGEPHAGSALRGSWQALEAAARSWLEEGRNEGRPDAVEQARAAPPPASG